MTGFSTARQYMVDGQVRPSDVTDDRILEAMLTVPREVFVPASKQALAYLDLDLDVTEGGTAKRYLITPALLARMLQAAEIKATDRVLVVGCATGYAAAALRRRGQRDRERSDAGCQGDRRGRPARHPECDRQDRSRCRWGCHRRTV